MRCVWKLDPFCRRETFQNFLNALGCVVERYATIASRVLEAAFIYAAGVAQQQRACAIAQIFAANNAHRLRSLTITNCDVHDGCPPKAVLPMIQSAREGTLADYWQKLLDDPDAARIRMARSFADPSVLTDDVIRVYLEPVLASAPRRDSFHRYWLGFDPAHTVVIEAGLRALRVPTLIVWALDDLFFELKWAHWLRDTIPGTVALVEVPDAKLFFPEDRPRALIEPCAGCCSRYRSLERRV
jgi:pimeloyl-ACP methyl ester carboxylesterase